MMEPIITTDNNRYLKSLLTEIDREGLDERLTHAFLLEMKFSQLVSPTHKGTPLCLKRDGKYYIIICSGLELYYEIFDWPSYSGLGVREYLMDLYLPVYHFLENESHIVRSNHYPSDASGLVIYNGDCELFIEGELLELFLDYFNIDFYRPGEIQEMFDEMDNHRLDQLLSQNPRDWDEIIPVMGESTIIYLMYLHEPRFPEFDKIDTFFHCFKMNPYGCRSEISIYTTKDIDIDDDKYVVVINVIDAVNHVMKFGVSGITLHYDGGEVFMSRELLIEKYELFEKYCSNSRLKQAHEMLFKL